MKIRSITYFVAPGWPFDDEIVGRAGKFLDTARGAYTAAGYEVQTTRLATTPFTQWIPERELGQLPEVTSTVELSARAAGIAYVSLGPASPGSGGYAAIPDALASSDNVFFGGILDGEAGLDLAAGRACADIVVRSSTIDPRGMANLRFAALANMPPGSPFFPAAFRDGGRPKFAIATEAADLAVTAFSDEPTVSAASQSLTAAIEHHGTILTRTARELSPEIGFGGIDFSLAPFPEETRSIGQAIERIGTGGIGRHGSLAAAAVITSALQRAVFARAGFSGLMLPLLEDPLLARRAAEGELSILELLLYSAVCGTGLDAIPIPGDVGVEELSAVLLDLGALALRLDKPLTARLMPIPGKQAGDLTDFEFDYFVNSRVLALKPGAMGGMWTANTTLPVNRRPLPRY